MHPLLHTVSIVASLIVSHVEEKDSMKRYCDAESPDEALRNAGVDDKRTLLFSGVDATRKSRLVRLSSIAIGISLIPITFFSSEPSSYSFEQCH